MRGYFLSNLNFDGTGGVIASPDADVLGGGSYRYHWARDGGLSMRAFMMSFVSGVTNSSLVQPYMLKYTQFVQKVHDQADPFGESILTEPKFNLPSGSVFSGGWCRPQNDGPSIRATTLMLWANQLIKSGQSDIVKEYLWTGNPNTNYGGVIKRDLDWVADGGWSQETCDLWEEVRSNDFFWNAMVHSRALFEGSVFANLMGDTDSSQRYLKAHQAVNATLMGHWNGQYLFESTNRPLDGAVLAALNDGVADDMPNIFPPTSQYVAATVKAEINAFCSAFPINNNDTLRGVPGVMIGRYPGDNYGGGNPWILLTNHLALVFYRGAEYALRKGEMPTEEALVHWREAMPHMPRKIRSHVEFAEAALAAGDGVLQRIRYHIKGDNFHMAEQIDKNTGFQRSATDLTWSYGTVLKAMYYRGLIGGLLKKN